MNTRKKGNKLENTVKRYFESIGYEVMLSRQSHSTFDMIAYPLGATVDTFPRFVQVKCNKISLEERAKIEKIKVTGYKELWIYKPKKGWQRCIHLIDTWDYTLMPGNAREVKKHVAS